MFSSHNQSSSRYSYQTDEVAALLAKARSLVTTFKRSTIANNVLKKKSELLLPDKQHKLILDCQTRWNSAYDMLEKLNEQSQVCV